MAYIDRNKVKEHENLTDEIGNDLLQIDKEYTGGSKVWLDVEFFHKLTKYFCLSNHLVKCLKILLDYQPTADVVEVKHGKWVVNKQCNHKPSRYKNPEKWVTYKCSECDYSNGRKISKYCPNCGAKMDRKEVD